VRISNVFSRRSWRVVGIAQVVEHLPSICEALVQSLATHTHTHTQKEKEKEEKEHQTSTLGAQSHCDLGLSYFHSSSALWNEWLNEWMFYLLLPALSCQKSPVLHSQGPAPDIPPPVSAGNPLFSVWLLTHTLIPLLPLSQLTPVWLWEEWSHLSTNTPVLLPTPPIFTQLLTPIFLIFLPYVL
jgi:hypothetical protein